jgi:hypothetical protein
VGELMGESKKKADPATGEIIPPAAPEPPAEKPWTNAKVTLEMAKVEKSSDGKPYWELPTDQLSFRLNSLLTSIKKNGLTPEQKAEKEIKRDVIQAIIEYRAQAEQPEIF